MFRLFLMGGYEVGEEDNGFSFLVFMKKKMKMKMKK